MNKIYLVKFHGGAYDDFYSRTIFATTKKATATKYVTRFNKLLKKYKEYYSRFEDGDGWIKDEYVAEYFHRWNTLYNITKCYYIRVDLR